MCLLRRHPLDPKTRRIFVAGNLCLASGLLLTIFAEGFGHRHPVLYQDLRFLLLGAAICLLLWSVRRARNDGSC
jgi:hypothetical protein